MPLVGQISDLPALLPGKCEGRSDICPTGTPAEKVSGKPPMLESLMDQAFEEQP
jgi:hypothetical protein